MNNDKWKGYTLEEVKVKRAITQLKIQFEIEKLKMTRQNIMSPSGSSTDVFSTVAATASQAMNVATSAMECYGLIKNLINKFRNTKK